MTSMIQVAQREEFGRRQLWHWAIGILFSVWFATGTLTMILLIAVFGGYSGLAEIARALAAWLPDPQWLAYAT